MNFPFAFHKNFLLLLLMHHPGYAIAHCALPRAAAACCWHSSANVPIRVCDCFCTLPRAAAANTSSGVVESRECRAPAAAAAVTSPAATAADILNLPRKAQILLLLLRPRLLLSLLTSLMCTEHRFFAAAAIHFSMVIRNSHGRVYSLEKRYWVHGSIIQLFSCTSRQVFFLLDFFFVLFVLSLQKISFLS